MGYDIGWGKKNPYRACQILLLTVITKEVQQKHFVFIRALLRPLSLSLYCKFSPSRFHCSIYLGGRCTCVPQQAPQLIKALAKKKKKHVRRGAASGASYSRLHGVMTFHWESEQRRGWLVD